MVQRVIHDVTIEADPDLVWSIVGDTEGIASWMPGVESCVVTGSIRQVGLAGGSTATEEIVERDDAMRSLSYRIVDSPMPIESHSATIRVTANGASTTATYELDVAPDELAAAFSPALVAALSSLKSLAESRTRR